MNVNLLATLRRVYLAPADEGSDLGGSSGALDIESRIANTLASGDENGELPEGAAATDALEEPELPETSDDEPAQDDVVSDEDATLASMLGLDEDKLTYDDAGNVMFNATIDGETHQVKVSDLVKSYQLEGHVTQKSMKLETDRREFESARDTAYGELTKRLTSANNLLAMAEQSLLQEFQGIDWNTLRATDPGEWSAARQYYSERMQQIEMAKNQVGQGAQSITAEQQQKMESQKQQFAQAEMQKMIADNPTWSDQNVMAKEIGDVGKFLHEQYGFHPTEVADHMDARLMRMVRDAMSFRSGKQALQTKKVPDNIPRFRKPNSQNVNRGDMQKARDAKAVKDNIRKTGGSTDSIAAALLNRM